MSAVLLSAVVPLVDGAAAATTTADKVDTLMHDLVDRNLFQGAVVVGTRGRIDYAAGFGFADIERQVRFTPDTPTDGGSMAKTFTAAALLQLATEQRVDLDAPVRDILPGYPHATTRVRHLLAHSAGLPGYEWLDARVPKGEPRTNASHLALVARDAPRPQFGPGSAFAYDNVAYDVAAMVVERTTNASYTELVTERFAQPLGLTAFVRPARFADWQGQRTRGYRRTATGWKDHDAVDFEGFHGGGNIYLSARDLYQWVSGYGRTVSPATKRRALAAARLDDGRSTGLSLGSWYVSADGGRYYYTGHHNGFHSFAYADDGCGLAVAWVANDAPPAWLQPALSRALIAIAEGREVDRLAAPDPAPSAADPSGTYWIADVGEVRVRRDGARLFVRLRDVEYAAFRVAQGVHYVPGLDAYLRFTDASGGNVMLRWDSVFVVAPDVARQHP